MKKITLLFFFSGIATVLLAQAVTQRYILHGMKINDHKVILDRDQKIISWIEPQSIAYDQFLHQRWNFIKNKVPDYPGTSYPEYYFSCGFNNQNYGTPSSWMNDIGEKIPNWFESARLYYAYTGDTSVMNIIKNFIDYTFENGTSPSTFSWPNFPYTTTNAGDLKFRGFTARLTLHEIQVDHAGDMGLTYYRMYLFTGNEKYKTAAINVANVLASKARTGSSTQSVWPYRVIMKSGEITAEYGANWFGAYTLLDNLIDANLGNVAAYKTALVKVREFILNYPIKTGYWTDGHTDTDITSSTYKSNMSASNAKLYILDHPEFDPDWKTNIPKLIKWTEDHFVFRCHQGEPATQWGANLVGEQDEFLPKMDYQTARYGAECARWYAVSGDKVYKEKAYRSLNWVTYCNDSVGMAYESPVSVGIETWWSDSYGECTRMFYHAFAGIPEWAPPGENHILYSEGVLKNVSYANKKVLYTATTKIGTEYLRLAFKPVRITVDGTSISPNSDKNSEGYTLKNLGNNDYAITITRVKPGNVIVSGL